MNSFGTLFPDKIFSLTFPWLLTLSLTFPWHVSNSLTFPGFPDKWSPCMYGLSRHLTHSQYCPKASRLSCFNAVYCSVVLQRFCTYTALISSLWRWWWWDWNTFSLSQTIRESLSGLSAVHQRMKQLNIGQTTGSNDFPASLVLRCRHKAQSVRDFFNSSPLHFPSPPLHSPALPLKVGPLKGGLGSAVSSPSGVWGGMIWSRPKNADIPYGLTYRLTSSPIPSHLPSHFEPDTVSLTVSLWAPYGLTYRLTSSPIPSHLPSHFEPHTVSLTVSLWALHLTVHDHTTHMFSSKMYVLPIYKL